MNKKNAWFIEEIILLKTYNELKSYIPPWLIIHITNILVVKQLREMILPFQKKKYLFGKLGQKFLPSFFLILCSTYYLGAMLF